MKEFNEPQPEQPEVIQEKKKPERRYIGLTVPEINELLDDYRKVLRKESADVKEIIISKIKELERELKRRS